VSFRKPSNKGGVKKSIGKFPSFRLNDIILFESNLEKDYLYLLEFDHLDVLNFRAQSCLIRYRLDGRKRRYTPDFYVERKHKTQVIEVKPEERALEPRYREVFLLAAAACAKKGWEFRVVTETTIRQEPRLENVKLLLKYQRTPLHPQHRILCREFFAGRRAAALAEVAEFFAAKGIGRQTLYSLMRWGDLGFDLMTPIDDDSPLFLPEQGMTAGGQRHVEV
jgi:hypothetical protein